MRRTDGERAVLIFLGIVAVIVVVVGIAKLTGPSAASADASYIASHRQDFNRITAGVATVEIGIGQAESAPAAASATAVDQLASYAQQTHDLFDNVYSNLNNSDDSSSGVVETWTASGELRDAMYDLVQYTGNPNPATLAKFSTQFNKAIGDWNQGVGDLWNSAHQSNPPIIKGPNGNTGSTGNSGNGGNSGNSG